MTEKTPKTRGLLRPAMLVLIVALAFVASYQFAMASNGAATSSTPSAEADSSKSSTSASSAGCACCSGATGTGETIEGAAAVENGVQKVSVDASNGYSPNRIRLVAGVPAEITFSNASSCLGQVMSEELGFFADFNDGPKTVRIEADKLQPGEYEFSCSMRMAFGTVVVE